MTKLNINPGQGYTPIAPASQYDVGRELVFTIYDGSSPASIPSGTIATMVGTKPSGLGFTQLGTVSGNTVTVITTATMTEEGGHIPAELRLTYSGNNIGTANFIFAVEGSPHTSDTTDGDAETARDLMTRAEEAVTDAEAASQAATAQAARAEAAADSIAEAGIDASTATAGQVPTANGSGSWSWADPAGGGTSDDIENASSVSGSTVSDALDSLSDEIASKQDTLVFDGVPTSGSDNPVTSGGVYDALSKIAQATSVKKYGVSGIGQSASALTRLYDAVGMTAEVGTDGDNSAVTNDFDSAVPWMWRKCVGYWTAGEDRAMFHVNAYYGDADYAEDGTMGDYVAVECPRSYYSFDGSTLVISAYQHAGFRPFDIFCHNHDVNDTIMYYYRPAYALGMKDGKAVSLPGLDNEQGAYKTLMDYARTYGIGSLSYLYPMALSFYDWAMFTVEFATQNCQNIMQGCAGLRHSNDDRLTFRTSTSVLVTNWYASRVTGEYVAITPTDVDINTWSIKPTHKITAVTRCTSDGTASSSGTYTLLELEDLGKNYYTYDTTGATQYRIAARPYRTGACEGVSTPSGSPVSNTDSLHPMRYRWVENLYGNQYKTTADFFNKRVGTNDSDYYLEHYYLLKPHEYSPASTSKPDATDLATSAFRKLGIETAHEYYANGYAKSKLYDSDYPDIWIPYETTGATGSTYTCDYASLVASLAVRSVRLYGYWSNGSLAGLSFFYGHYAPSTASASFGADLCFAQ